MYVLNKYLGIKIYYYNKKFWLFYVLDIVYFLFSYENNFRIKYFIRK